MLFASKRETPRAARAKWLYAPAALAALLLLPIAALSADPPAATLTAASTTPITWNGTAVGSGSADESTCVEGVNCDTFVLYVGGSVSSWARRIIKVDVSWGLPANDYDLYIHKDSNAGPVVGNSGNGAPTTKEAAAIDPYATGVGFYTIRVVYFATTPQTDQYVGTATVIPRPQNRQATYIRGGMAFSTPTPLKAPVAERDGEPSLRIDKFGNTYAAGIRGVPAGVDLWYMDLNPTSDTYDPFLRKPIYRGQPDSFTQDEMLAVGADGGGDVDLAVGFDEANPGSPPIIAFSSLVAANISTAISTDKGVNWTLNPLGNVTGGIPVDDRQWLEFKGKNEVYLLYRTFQPAVTQIQKSMDGGLTWGAARTAGAIGQVGCIDVDQNDGTVYISGSSGQIAVGIPDPILGEPITYTNYQVADDPAGVANIFFVVKVADDGTVYACYSNGTNVYLKHSTDKGQTWSRAVRVNDGTDTRTAMLPWIETGRTPGAVGVVWYGSSSKVNTDAAYWKVFYAFTPDARVEMPTFTTQIVTPHYIHGGNISTGGTLGDANRNLLDYFQLAFDPLGAPVIAFTDDHNDFDGHTYVSRMFYGPSAGAVDGGEIKVMPPNGVPTEPPGKKPAHHVTDFAQDVAEGLLVVVPVNDPLDILWIDYATETATEKMLVAKMKVSDLSTVPPLANWRMHFTANAPGAALSYTKDYNKGVSDKGDQFFVRATTPAVGAPIYEWGTAVRNYDGSITYTTRGTADAGSIDPATGMITVKVALSKLNAFARAPLTTGSVLCGLRGSAYTSGSSSARRDATRGGTQYNIQ